MNNPSISVIVRTKDRPDSLSTCLHSVAAQRYKNLAVVLVNDGGQDVSSVIEKFSGSLSINLIQHEKSLGRTKAANAGLAAAKGDYIIFLDDDDYWLPSHLSMLVELLADKFDSKKGCAVYSSTKAVLVDDAGEEQEIKVYAVEYDKQRLLYENFLPIHSVLFSRIPIEEGVRFDETFDLFEDWDFWIQLSQYLAFFHLPEANAVYRLHTQSSGVHEKTKVENAYQYIYKKWLSRLSNDELSSLLHATHAWHEEEIEIIQQANTNKLDAIGGEHSNALNVIAKKDQNIKQLELAHADAIAVIESKDKAIASLSEQYENALSVIASKDGEIASLTEQYENAIKVISSKDEGIESLTKEYEHAIHVIGSKDRETANLVKEYEYAISVIESKDKEIESKDQDIASKNQLINELKAIAKRPMRYMVKKAIGRGKEFNE